MSTATMKKRKTNKAPAPAPVVVPEKKKKVRVKALPSIVYRYGCTVRFPQDEEIIQEQWFLQNRYRNALVEIEQQRRAAHNAIRSTTDTQIAEVEAKLAALEVAKNAIHDERKQRNIKARKRQKYPDLVQQLKDIAAARKACNAEKKELKAQFYANPKNKPALKAADDAANVAKKTARKVAGSKVGLFWCNYMLVENAAKDFGRGTPPKFKAFHRYNGGAICVQIQRETGEEKLTPQKLWDEGDDMVRVIPIPMAENASNRQKKRPWVRLFLCVGGNDPLKRISKSNPRRFVEVRVSLHRPLPAHAHITWVTLQARRLGLRLKWEVLFTMASVDGFPREKGEKAVGIDIGWRINRDELAIDSTGSVRVAYWAGSDGKHGELRLPADLVSALQHKSTLQQTRDKEFDKFKVELLEWKKANTEKLPEWFTEETSTLTTWKSEMRLRKLVRHWQFNRFEGDAAIFATAHEWWRHDRHLLHWQANEAERSKNRRDDIYRKFAHNLSQQYGRLCGMEDIDLRCLVAKDDVHRNYHINRSTAAVSRFRNCIEQRLKTSLVPPANTSRRCHKCGEINDVGSSDVYMCAYCNWTGDRDHNAAINILRAAEKQENALEVSTPTV